VRLVAIVPAVPSVFPTISTVFPTISPVFSSIPPVFVPIASILTTIPAVFVTVATLVALGLRRRWLHADEGCQQQDNAYGSHAVHLNLPGTVTD
jgi:hypothetical protein